jgi:hypothetical protein
VANLLLVLLIPVAFASGVIDTGCKYVTSIVDTIGKFATGINDQQYQW